MAFPLSRAMLSYVVWRPPPFISLEEGHNSGNPVVICLISSTNVGELIVGSL